MMSYKAITTYQKRWWHLAYHLAKNSNKKEKKKGYLGAFLWRRAGWEFIDIYL